MRKLLRKYGSLGSAGLTLVELIISMAILAIVGTAVGGAMYVSSRSYTRSSAEVNVQEEAQVASNLICDWLMDATSVNPDSANAGHYLTGAYDYLLITHPEGNKLVNIKVFRDGDTLKYEVKDADTNADMGSGILCSYVKGCVFNTTFESDRNVTISIDFEVNGRTYHSVTDSSSRNHDFQSTGGGFTSGPPIIVIPDTTVVLEPGQDGDPEAGGTGYVFVATLYNCDPATTVFTPAVGTPATSGDVTIVVAEGDNPGEYKIICSAPSGAATASGTFTLHAQNGSGSDDEVLNVVIRRTNQCVPSVGNGTQVDASVASSTPVTFDLGLQNQSVVAGAGFDSGVYGYVDPSQVTYFYRVYNSTTHAWEDALAKGYISSHTEVTSGTPSVMVSLNSTIPDNLYVICVANHSGSINSVLTGIGCSVNATAANKVSAISHTEYTYAGSNAFWGYFIVKKNDIPSPFDPADNGFRRGEPSFEIARIDEDYLLYLKPALLSYWQENHDASVTDIGGSSYFTYTYAIKYKPLDNSEPERTYVISRTGAFSMLSVLTGGHGFVQMNDRESYLLSPNKDYSVELIFETYDNITHDKIPIAGAPGEYLGCGSYNMIIPACRPYVYNMKDTNSNMFYLNTYSTPSSAYEYTSASKSHNQMFYVYFNNMNVKNGTKPGFRVEVETDTGWSDVTDTFSSSIKWQYDYEGDYDQYNTPPTWYNLVDLYDGSQDDGYGVGTGKHLTAVTIGNGTENPTYEILRYNENQYPTYGVVMAGIQIGKSVPFASDHHYRIVFDGNYTGYTSSQLNSSSQINFGSLGYYGSEGSINCSTSNIAYDLTGVDTTVPGSPITYGYIYIDT